MTPLIRFTLTAIIAITSFGLLAQEPLSLSQAIEIGLANNYQIQIAQQDVAIAQNNNDWAIAGKYPTINLTLSNNNSYNAQNSPASFLQELSSFGTSVTPGIEANWVLFDGYRVRFNKQQLEQAEQLSQGNLQLEIEATIQSIILAYYTAQLQKEQVEVLGEVLTLSRDRVEYQEVRRDFGQAGTFDVLQTQDAYFNDSISYITQQSVLNTAMKNLKLAMGEDDLSKSFTLTDQLEFSTEAYDLEDLRTKMLSNNKSLQLLFVNRELANINSKIENTARMPTVSARAGLTYNSSWTLSGTGTFRSGEELDLGGVNNTNTNGFLNLTATYNLFDAGVRKRRIENAKKEEIIAQLTIEDLKRDLNNALEITLGNYNLEQEVVEVSTELMTNARQNLDIAEERFRGGLINSFDYRTIQLGYINASQRRLNAIFNLKNTETELIRLIGGLIR